MDGWRYLAVFAFALVLGAPAFLVWRTAPIGCPTIDRPDRFLAFCRNGRYQDFEHGAYALGLRPAAVAAARHASVLVLGNSRIELALSGPATADAFAGTGLSYYLLGFGFGETDHFAARLIRDLGLHPTALVIDVDPFFDGALSEPAAFLQDRPARAALDYRAKAAGAALFAALCPPHAADWPCGGALALLRDDATGGWVQAGPWPDAAQPFDPRNGKSADPLPYVEEARRFLQPLGLPPHCVILTTVPTPQRPLDAETVRRIAEAIGASWSEPVLDGMSSFDRSHLARDSAERWSAAFLRDIMPILEDCASPRRGMEHQGTDPS